MGAELTVESTPGQGATFALRLKRGTGRSATPDPTGPRPLRGASTRMVS
jgi:hypothetical protein